jgi:hypothetical protein
MKKTYHRHIDNGGISVEVSSDEDARTSLSICADYNGYPAVSSSLTGLTRQDLREIGLMFFSFAADIDEQQSK